MNSTLCHCCMCCCRSVLQAAIAFQTGVLSRYTCLQTYPPYPACIETLTQPHLPCPACAALTLSPTSGLSTYLPLRKEPPLVSEANMKTPIFQAHGDADYTVSGTSRC